MTFLGIDPGTTITGYGVIRENQGQLCLVDYGCIYTKGSLGDKFKKIYSELEKVLKTYKPQAVAIEKLFFCKNIKTAIDVGQARGVILLQIAMHGLPICELTPLQVKQAVTGDGRATKEQVQKMVKILLNLKNLPKPDDAADALALAISCAAFFKNKFGFSD